VPRTTSIPSVADPGPAVRRIVRGWWVAGRCLAVSFRAQLEYRGNFAFAILYGAAWQTATLVLLATLLARFRGLGEFNGRQVLFVYGMRMLTHGLYVVSFDNLTEVSTLVDQGRFDGYLLRPMSPLVQVVVSKFRVNALGDLTVGCTTFVVAALLVDVRWAVAPAGYVVLALVGGVLIEGAIQLLVASLVLRWPGYRLLGSWFDETITTIGSYPLSIFPTSVQAFLTFVLPLAFAAYLPARQLFRMPAAGWLGPAQLLSPAVGFVLFAVARAAWGGMLRHYRSAGG
jgi:ABC-2 type transport system permease protein